jgi:hypothetical protein
LSERKKRKGGAGYRSVPNLDLREREREGGGGGWRKYIAEPSTHEVAPFSVPSRSPILIYRKERREGSEGEREKRE